MKIDLGTNCKKFRSFPCSLNLSTQNKIYPYKYTRRTNTLSNTKILLVKRKCGEQGAGMYLGFNRDVMKEKYERAIQKNV